MAAFCALIWATEGREGIVLCGREFMNSLADSSFAEVKAAIASESWLADVFDVGETYMRTKCRKISFVFAELRHNLDSIKSNSKREFFSRGSMRLNRLRNTPGQSQSRPCAKRALTG
jgi:phage terminase large subunit